MVGEVTLEIHRPKTDKEIYTVCVDGDLISTSLQIPRNQFETN